MSQPAFTWLSRIAVPPGRWDLRNFGWSFAPVAQGAGAQPLTCPALLDWREDYRPADWQAFRPAPSIVALGVEDPEDRAALLRAGFGDALPTRVALVELSARLVKIDSATPKIPRQRRAGPVTLDLFHRDGRLGTRWLGLHPREFALLWRLCETPFRRVSKRELLADVWRLDHVPETNSVEVHVSRLRGKLALSGVGWLVHTCEGRGYQLGHESPCSFAAFSHARRETLDTRHRIGNLR